MDTKLFRYLKEYSTYVPARLYGIILSLITVIGSSIALIVWLNDHGLAWWWILLYALSVIVYIVLSFIAFYRVSKERDELKKYGTISDGELKLMGARRDFRNHQTPEVTRIPVTLKATWDLVKDITNAKEKKKPTDEKLLEVIVDFLQIDKNDPLLKIENYTTEQRIRKSAKVLKKKMGMVRRDEKKMIEWGKRISESMDEHHIGLILKDNQKNSELMRQLDIDSVAISTTSIYQKAREFLELLISLYNVRLLVHYGGTTKRLYIFPKDMRETLVNLEKVIDTRVHASFGIVKKSLEDYSIGREFTN